MKIALKRLPKISDEIKKVRKEVKLVLFKAESGVSDSELIKMALKKLKQSNADLILANDISRKGIGFGSDMNEVILIGKKGVIGRERGEKSISQENFWIILQVFIKGPIFSSFLCKLLISLQVFYLKLQAFLLLDMLHFSLRRQRQLQLVCHLASAYCLKGHPIHQA